MNNLKFGPKTLAIEVTTQNSTHIIHPQELFLKNPFIIIFQPGAGQAAAMKDLEKWGELGLKGCTDEACNYGKTLSQFEQENINIFIVNTMSSKQQQDISINKKFNPALKFISDPESQLAELFGVGMVSANQAIVHRPTIGLYNNKGECLETIIPDNAGTQLAKRKDALEVLNRFKVHLTPTANIATQPQYQTSATIKF